MDYLYIDYDPKSTRGRMDRAFQPESVRKITLHPPGELQSSLPSGLPKYDPAVMPHQTLHEFKYHLNYIPPFSYYIIHALKAHFASISPMAESLSSQVLVGEERVNIVDSLLPHAKHNMDYVDPPTWATLIQIFDGLPERCFRYTLALNDPHLPTLATIQSSTNFSVVTFLDLSGCAELLDQNITFLKGLASLCVLDTSHTKLTDRGVGNFKSGLFLQEPGPVYLRSWSLRGCEGVTIKTLSLLMAFPLLCVLDLRDTSISPSQVNKGFWSRASRLPTSANMKLFAPNPQNEIPKLLQTLEKSSFLHSQDDPGAKSPYVIHIDRIRPKPRHSQYSSRARQHSGSVFQISQHAYYVGDSYHQTSGREDNYHFGYYNPPPRWHTNREYDDSDYSSAEADYEGGYGSPGDHLFSDDQAMDRESEDGSESASMSGYSNGGVSDEPRPMGVPLAHQPPVSPLPPSTHHRSSSPTTPDRPTSEYHTSPKQTDIPLSSLTALLPIDVHTASSDLATSSSTTRDIPKYKIGSSPNQGVDPEPSFLTTDVDILHEALERETNAVSRPIPGFFNARVEAGLAVPRQKRQRHSSESSESRDEEEDRREERRRFSHFGDQGLALLRRPPPWSTAQKLVTAKKRAKVSAELARKQHQSGQSGHTAQLPKKKKVVAGTGIEAWKHIKASSAKSASPSGGLDPASTPVSRAFNTIISFPPTALSEPSQAPENTVRRTTLGRPPRAPGTTVWKQL